MAYSTRTKSLDLRHSFIYFLLLPSLLLFPSKLRLTPVIDLSPDAHASGVSDSKTEEREQPLADRSEDPPPSKGLLEKLNSLTATQETREGPQPGDTTQFVDPSVAFSVDDFTGAAHVRYPIEVPPARAGLSPRLVFDHTTAGRNGWLGVGWEIPVGFIQRMGWRKSVPKYDDTDIFYLSLGDRTLQELVPIGGDEYRLKTEGPFYKIKFYPDSNYWELWNKSGVKMRFGYSTDSRIGRIKNPVMRTDTYRWHLDRVDDPDTNYIEYLYWKDQDTNNTYQIYLQEVRYNGQASTGLPHNHRILFNLQSGTRGDPIYDFRGGFKALTNKRLASIEVKTNDVLVRKYQLEYEKKVLSRLISITLYDSNNKENLPPTKFYYNEHYTGFNSGISYHNPTIWQVLDGDGNILETHGNNIVDIGNDGGLYADVLDMDGDGFPDRVVYDREYPFNTWNLYYGDGQTGFAPRQDWPLNASFAESTWTGLRSEYVNGVDWDMIDMDGDGLKDWVFRDAVAPYNTWSVAYNDGDRFYPWVNWPLGATFQYIENNYIQVFDWQAPGFGKQKMVIDMNGDGLPDWVSCDMAAPYYNTWKVRFNTGSGFGPATDWPLGATFPTMEQNYIQWKESTGHIKKDLIDMNGDGLPDWVTYDSTSPYNTWKVRFNTGSGFSAPVDWPNRGNPNQECGSYIRSMDAYGNTITDVIDLNGDGLPDRVYAHGPLDQWRVYYNNGTGFDAPVPWSIPYNCYLGTGRGFIRTVDGGGITRDLRDMNGDGLLDYVTSQLELDSHIPQTESTWNVCLNNGPFPNLLKKVENGIGGTIQIAYKKSSAYPNTFLPFVLRTVSSFTVDDGKGTVATTDYTYEKGLYKPEEREFWGFGYVKQTKPNDTTVETWFKQETTCSKGLPTHQVTKNSLEEKFFQVVNTYDYKTPSPGVCFPSLKEKHEYEFDGQTTARESATSFAYDSYGNVISKYYQGDVTVSNDQKEEYTEYQYDTVNYIVGLPTVKELRDDFNGTVKAKTTFLYDATKPWQLRTRKRWLDLVTGYGPEDRFDYDTYGNLSKIYDPNGNPPTIIAYDAATKTYPYETTNPKGHVTTTTYFPGIGKLASFKDANGYFTGAETTYDYDPFGRLIKITKPDDFELGSYYGTVSYEYTRDSGFQKITTRATEETGDTNPLNFFWKETYIDGLGRVYKTRQEGPSGKVIVTKTLYNQRGFVSDISLPFYEGEETIRYKSFLYDPLGRVKQITYPDSTFSTMTTVKGAKTIIDQNGHKKKEQRDVYGRLTKVEEYTGVSPNFSLYATTTYQYTPLDDLELIQDHLGNVTQISYDALSRKLWMVDPDMGRWDYEYDLNGNLIKQWDARRPKDSFPSNPIQFTLDELNRIILKDYHDTLVPNITYVYDELSSTNGIGRLTSVTDSSGMTQLFYDERGRTTKTIKTIDSTPYTIETTYDSLDRVRTIKYPDNETVTYNYDTGGNLDSIPGVVTYSSYTALGQPGLITYNNGVTTTRTYYAQNKRLRSIVTSGNLQNLTYNYDDKGNVTSITDAIDITRSQSFVYDHLDRLTQAHSTSYGKITYNYNEIGNMTHNSQVGIYSYGDGGCGIKPHAVTQAGPNNYTYDCNGNMKTGAGRRYTWDYDNKPLDITYNGQTTSFEYDYQGQRARKASLSERVIYIGKLYECANGGCSKYVFGGNARIDLNPPSRKNYNSNVPLAAMGAITEPSQNAPQNDLWRKSHVPTIIIGTDMIGSVYNKHTVESEKRVALKAPSTTLYYHMDHLGSSNVISTIRGTNCEEIYYFPYGATRLNSGSCNVRHKFTAQEEDGETGLYYYGARYYDASLGRFISADSITPDYTNPQALNRYSYVLNNPLYYTDPTGHLERGEVDQSDNANNSSVSPDSSFSAISELCNTVGLTGVFGFGATLTALTGIDIAFGFYGPICSPTPGKGQFGVFGTIGPSGGFNISADIFGGYVQTDALQGTTINTTAGYKASITSMTDVQTGRPVGKTVGFGPLGLGVSASVSTTGTISIADYDLNKSLAPNEFSFW